MKKKRLVESLNYAILGIVESLKRERNMQIHLIIGFLVLMFSLFSHITKMEFLAVIFAIAFVIVTEMINTAIEKTLDAIINYTHPLVRIAKDISAGAVLVAAINAMIVGYMVFWEKVRPTTEAIINIIKNSSPHVVLVVLVIVILITILAKVVFRKGTPLKGGMPSGHSAIAFSIATVIAYYSTQLLIIFLAYIMALIVAQSRVDSDVHSILEVILGGVLGILTTLLILILI